MEWMMEVNQILKDEITKVNNSLIPPGFEGDVRSIRAMQDSLSKLVDRLGAQSAAAQGLNRVITTADKLRTADAHSLYLLKDAAAKNGRGEVVGMLKVGRKHLFLFDEEQRVRECEPLCVLDFFVLRDYQRGGRGKRLFNHMLQDQQTTVSQLAVDGPSEMMERFLCSGYGVQRLLRQSNNFAVAPQFFDSAADNRLKPCERQCRTPRRVVSKCEASTPSQAAVGRYTAHKPQSSIGNVIHGATSANPNGNVEPSQASAAPLTAATPPRATPSEVAPAAAPPVPPALNSHRSPSSRPRTLPVCAAPAVDAPAAPTPAPPPALSAEPTPAGAPSRRDSQLTEKGFFDVKFYHKKLW